MSRRKPLLEDLEAEMITLAAVEDCLNRMAKKFPREFKVIKRAHPRLRAIIIARWTLGQDPQFRRLALAHIRFWIDPTEVSLDTLEN